MQNTRLSSMCCISITLEQCDTSEQCVTRSAALCARCAALLCDGALCARCAALLREQGAVGKMCCTPLWQGVLVTHLEVSLEEGTTPEGDTDLGTATESQTRCVTCFYEATACCAERDARKLRAARRSNAQLRPALLPW